MSKFTIGRLGKLEDRVWEDVYEWCMSWIETSFGVECAEDLSSDQLWEIADYVDRMFDEQKEAELNFTNLSIMHGMVLSTLNNIVDMNEERMEER